MPREHGEGGEFVETTSLADVLGVFESVEGPVITSSDVSDELGCTRDTARRKLTTLHEQERVARRKTAGRIVWWRTADESEDTESERFSITDCSLDFYSGRARVTFANSVSLTVSVSDEAGTSFELTHPDNAAETWTDSIERRPAEILLEILDDYYNASGEDRAVTVPALDTYMQEVETDD